ncbi:Hypothetical predicted protein [Paramuricea clavata]|uniref:Uncharacterized protein n=1 Tax=Paramuricea clavata TaxID=317549 RepID=A0A6S7I7T3_PARCT|nr:Hypothetical predicted protein [Paramuricea clavata]
MIDSKDAKAKVQSDVSPVQKPGKTWRKITLPDHDWNAVAHNSITPMMHLFMETELHLEDATKEEDHYTVKRSVDNGSSEAPSHPMVKMWLARMANVLELKSLTQKSFAEYHSKRNPVERVHAVENRALSNEVFTSTGVHKEYEKDDQQHLENMEFVANEVGKSLQNA